MARSKEVAVVEIEPPVEQKFTEKTANIKSLNRGFEVVRFMGQDFMKYRKNLEPFTTANFSARVYRILGAGMRKSAIQDLEHFYRTTARDISENFRYIMMGDLVWDTKLVDFTTVEDDSDIVFDSPFTPQFPDTPYSNKFIMDLANGDKGVYDDIFFSIAPLITHIKPTGVIWWQGSGANGKSALAKLLHRIFREHITSIDIKSIEDERDTPALNGKLGNIVLEASDHYVQNARLYKSIGAHENFSVHKFHSQEMIEVNGNIHHIFNCNNMPGFADKTDGAKRRTLVVRFTNKFKDDPTFEQRTFTTEFISLFLGELIQYAKRLKDNGYKYSFSGITEKVKKDYDEGSNTTATFMVEMMATDICGFQSFQNLHQIYYNWCGENGFVPMKINNFRKTIVEMGFERKGIRTEQGVRYSFVLNGVVGSDIELIPHSLGIYRRVGSPFTGILNPIMADVSDDIKDEFGERV